MMTRREIVTKAIAGKLTWSQAAEVLGITPRHMRRIRTVYREYGMDAFYDNRGGHNRRRKISEETVAKICRLKEEVYPDFSMQHYYEKLTEEHGVQISYSWMSHILQEAGIVKKTRGRGKYFRQRERRPMRGMMLHIDASTHEWIPGIPKWDLVAVMDDADGRLLYAQFFEKEGTLSTFAALHSVLKKHGRFCELYHDKGTHYGRARISEEGSTDEHHGQVARAMKVLGIRQIFANTPQARGRSERAFGTLQGRLPQELRVAGITTYQDANTYLKKQFIRSFNRRFTVKPRQPEDVFVSMTGIDLDLLLSAQYERTVKNDNTVQFQGTILQLPSTRTRHHYARCPVLVHKLITGSDDPSRYSVRYHSMFLCRPFGKIVAYNRQALRARGGEREEWSG